jgi:hypothetical protein
VFRGVAASGKQVTDTGITIYRFEGGQLAQAWLQTDRLGVLQQIGVVPADLTLQRSSRAGSGSPALRPVPPGIVRECAAGDVLREDGGAFVRSA